MPELPVSVVEWQKTELTHQRARIKRLGRAFALLVDARGEDGEGTVAATDLVAGTMLFGEQDPDQTGVYAFVREADDAGFVSSEKDFGLKPYSAITQRQVNVLLMAATDTGELEFKGGIYLLPEPEPAQEAS